MLFFLPPFAGPPRRNDPEPRRGSAIGIALAIILTVVGMLLPWLRPEPHRASRDAPAPVQSSGGDPGRSTGGTTPASPR